PGPDDDGVDVRVGHKVLPALDGAPDAILPGDGRGRFGPAIANGDDLDIGQRLQSRNVTSAGVGSGADQPDTHRSLGHDVLPPLFLTGRTAKRQQVGAMLVGLSLVTRSFGRSRSG